MLLTQIQTGRRLSNPQLPPTQSYMNRRLSNPQLPPANSHMNRRLSIPQIPSLELLQDMMLYPEGEVETHMVVHGLDKHPDVFESNMDDIASNFLPKELKKYSNLSKTLRT